MYQIAVYPITADLWRWEIRCAGRLVLCGTALTRGAAARDVNQVFNA
jgi:hypothetical protein